MSKVIKSIGSIFGGIDKPKVDVSKYASQVGGQPTPEEIAEQRAALAAQGRRPKEEEMQKQKEMGIRPLQGSNSISSFWT